MQNKKWFVYKCRRCGNLIATRKGEVLLDPAETTAVEFSRKLHRNCSPERQKDDRVFADLVTVCEHLDLTTVQDVFVFIEYTSKVTKEYAARRVHVEDIDKISKRCDILTDLSFLDGTPYEHHVCSWDKPNRDRSGLDFATLSNAYCRFKREWTTNDSNQQVVWEECCNPRVTKGTLCDEATCPLLNPHKPKKKLFISVPMNQKIFISQPMNGKSAEEIKRVYNLAAEELRSRGYDVVDSCLRDDVDPGDRKDDQISLFYLAKSLEILSTCDAIYLCRGWENARGCRIEKHAAEAYGLEIHSSKEL